MNTPNPLCFAVYRLPTAAPTGPADYGTWLQTLGLPLTLSLRCLYDPDVAPPSCQSYLYLHPHTPFDEAALTSHLQQGSLSQWYQFKREPDPPTDLTWVKAMSEVVKAEDEPTVAQFEGYLPHVLPCEAARPEASLPNILTGRNYGRLLLEFSLDPPPAAAWPAAIDLSLTLLNELHSSHASIQQAIKLYQTYQARYLHAPTFRYSIKALAARPHEDKNVLEALLGQLQIQADLPKPRIVTLTSADFTNSLQATREVRLFQPSGGTSTALAIRPINQTTNSSSLTKYVDSSLQPSWEKLQPQPKVADLKQLRYLTIYPEVAGWVQLLATALSEPPRKSVTAEEIFAQYRHRITPDEYIVGLDQHGKLVMSSWADIPHRLVAGQTGFGKTNFIKWLIFQFIYANPGTTVYLMDFKGVDFTALVRMFPNIKLITEVDEAFNVIDKIDEEEQERKRLINQHGVNHILEITIKGKSLPRLLWVIDEAADIADAAYSLAEKIEKKLKQYARKGRSFGIQVVYAAQRPDSAVITKQVVDQLGEKIIFKVTAQASLHVIEIEDGEYINQKGQAILYRGRKDWFYVQTPLMSQTIWQYLKP